MMFFAATKISKVSFLNLRFLLRRRCRRHRCRRRRRRLCRRHRCRRRCHLSRCRHLLLLFEALLLASSNSFVSKGIWI